MKKYLQQFFDNELIEKVLKSNKFDKNLNKKKTKLDLEIIKTLYVDYNLPMYKIAMLYGVSDATIRRLLLKAEVKLKGHKCGKNSFNNYFEKIDSRDKAYYLGLIFADGNITKDKRINKGESKVFQIALTKEDKYILEKLNDYASFNSKLVISHKEEEKPRYSLIINSSKYMMI